MAGEDRSTKHPSPAQLSRFLAGEMSGSEAAPVVAHLLTKCQHCREQMEPLTAVMFAKGAPPEPPATDGTEYDFPIFRAFATARRYAESLLRERREGEERPLREVPSPAPLPVHERSLRDELRCHKLLERSRSLRQSDPEGMVMSASLAVSLAEQIAPGALSLAELADLQARAWAELGNSLRVADDLPESEAALARALERTVHGTGDPRLLGLLMDLTASLYVDQRRFAEAVRLLDCTYALYRSLGETRQAGRTLISKGIATGYALDNEGAVRLIGEGLGLIDAQRDPKLVLAAVHSILYFLVEDGRLAEASRLLELSRSLYTAQGGRLDVLKARWLEGLIAAGLGDDASAEQALAEVRTGFTQAELHYDAALAGLALAEVWLRGGRTRQIQRLVDEMLSVFRARKIRREAIAALLVLREALAREGATVALLRSVASEIAGLKREPARQAGLAPG
ncbi:MAG TPA: tetratricopeptide repeat protein [Thermoanaerobaculia bacterium]|nr:tetratricopeptide repeat protein [Thermoanaerobaculia bacterium]